MLRFRLIAVFLSASVLFPVQTNAQSRPSRFSRQVKLPGQLQEVSGMTFLPDETFWMLNDSQNPAELYCVNPVSGRLEKTVPLHTSNRDWEDLTSDDSGSLFIGDFGNNQNKRRDLRIYIFDPKEGSLDSILFSYPDQVAFPPTDVRDMNFDMEAFVYFKDSLHLFSKHRFKGDFVCKHYILPASPGKYTARLVESRVISERVITGAAVNSSGSVLALTGYIAELRWGFIPRTRASAMFFTSFADNRFLSGDITVKRLPKFLIARQFESITYSHDNIWLVANEGRKWQKQRLWRLKGPSMPLK